MTAGAVVGGGLSSPNGSPATTGPGRGTAAGAAAGWLAIVSVPKSTLAAVSRPSGA